MTQALQIDTLAFFKRLKKAGADDRLAEAIVEGITATDTSELATKVDFAEVRAELAKFENALKAEIAETKTEVLKWMFGMMVAQAGFIIAVIKFL